MEGKTDFCSISGSFTYRDHFQERQTYMCLKKTHFLSPLKYVDVGRRANTTFDVLLEHKIDDFWNVDVTGNYQGHGQFSPNSRYRIMLHLEDTCGPGRN